MAYTVRDVAAVKHWKEPKEEILVRYSVQSGGGIPAAKQAARIGIVCPYLG